MNHLRARIEQAFPLFPIPEAPILITYDDEGIIPRFLGRAWNSFTVHDLRAHSAAISFLSAEAFLYYLPTLVVATIEDPKVADIIPDNLLSKFGQVDAANSIDYLSVEQRTQAEV